MTKKDSIKFLKRQQKGLISITSPHDVLKWLRVMQFYFINLFGADSDLYKAAFSTQLPDIQTAEYDRDLLSLKTKMDWLLDDCIHLVNSGIADHKFDKNWLYRLSDGALATLAIFIVTILFFVGVFFQKIFHAF